LNLDVPTARDQRTSNHQWRQAALMKWQRAELKTSQSACIAQDKRARQTGQCAQRENNLQEKRIRDSEKREKEGERIQLAKEKEKEEERKEFDNMRASGAERAFSNFQQRNSWHGRGGFQLWHRWCQHPAAVTSKKSEFICSAASAAHQLPRWVDPSHRLLKVPPNGAEASQSISVRES
jgi:hypothetical protein